MTLEEMRRIHECNAAAARLAPDANLEECRTALLVFVLTPATFAWLSKHDPMALRQAKRALNID